MRKSLDGKVAVVTGACGLLGREHCKALLSSGAQVVVADMKQEDCERTAFELDAVNRVLPLALDVTCPKSINALLEKVESTWGIATILVNNAAMNDKVEGASSPLEFTRFENLRLEDWQKALDVNVTGVMLMCQAFGPRMIAAGGGSIINIASTYGLVAPDQSIYKDKQGRQLLLKSAAYPTSKSAVIGFTKFLAAYWGDKGVRVNALCPGGVENGQTGDFIENYSKKTPMGRMAMPEEYQGAIAFLAGPGSSYMTGTCLIVDGGWTCW